MGLKESKLTPSERILADKISTLKRMNHSLTVANCNLKNKLKLADDQFQKIYALYQFERQRMSKKVIPTEADILSAIQGIKRDLLNGDSLTVARKRNCGHSNTNLFKAVSLHADYQPILIEYGKSKGCSNQYTRRAKNIINGETPSFYAWIINLYGRKVYSIHKLNTELIKDISKDLMIKTDETTGYLHLISRAFTKSISFNTAELMNEYEKSQVTEKSK